ncbi:hypothetical protein DYB32_005873 [Aphanomyces invadans]|nr:hypothetical protein DYB32_005873 [Aphanomyces invadans]
MDVVLVRASKAQQLTADKNTYSSWGAPQLTFEEYLDREHELIATPFAKETLTGYVLVPKSNPTTDDILCYVEVFKRPVWYKSTRLNGYSVGSVYTPAKHRKKGYAATTLKLIQEGMRADQQQNQPSGTPTIVISNLYSDIGPKYYASKGWTVYASQQLVLPATHSLPAISSAPLLVQVESLDALTRVCQADIARMQLQTQASATPAVYFELTPSAVLWFHTRAAFYARTKRSLASAPTSHGVFIASGTSIDSFIVWTHDFKNNALTVLRCHTASPAIFPTLLDAALRESRAWSLASVVVWNPEAAWLTDDLRALVASRDDSLPSLLVTENQKAVEGVHWLGNDKYVWV